MIIPWRELSKDALMGLLEEFITREGTDYGEVEVDLADKVAQLQSQLQRGEVVIVYDAVLQTTSLITRQMAREWAMQGGSVDGVLSD